LLVKGVRDKITTSLHLEDRDQPQS